LEQPFLIARDAIQQGNLCGPGHAFLSIYYLRKRLLERSQQYLDEALRVAPDDPWVKLTEAAFYEAVTYDDQKAIHILVELNQRDPSFPLARYLLGKTYIREEEFGKANTSFQSLKEDIKGQVAFWRIRRALSSLEQAGDESVAKAEGLLALSRAFTALRDYPMAQHLYRWILEEMPGRLPKKDLVAAYCELGRIYKRGGDSNSAYDSYRNALEIDPDFPDARDGIRSLLPHPSNQS
jgi:cytochrome c-type biogenesis protein CcmH/NrfG